MTDYKTDTQYGRTRYTVPVGGRQGILIMPRDDDRTAGPVPWVWYAPSFYGRLPGERQEWYFTRLLDAGCAVAGMDVDESMGNPAGRKLFSAFYDAVVPEFGLDPKAVLLPQSRGGLQLYNWAAENPDKVRCVAGIYTVCNIRCYPGIGRAAEAYGMSVDAFEAQADDHSPYNRLQPLVDAGIPVMHIHGDEDELIPVGTNSRELIRRYVALGGRAHLKMVLGKGHEEVDEFFCDGDLLRFMLSGGSVFPG